MTYGGYILSSIVLQINPLFFCILVILDTIGFGHTEMGIPESTSHGGQYILAASVFS